MHWFEITNASEIPSPALLVFEGRVEENLAEMLYIAGGPGRLRPHIKTHKLPELVRRQMDLGITKFKCATVVEAEMAAGSGATNVLLAYQPVGPSVEQLADLAARHPGTRFGCLVDNEAPLRALSEAAKRDSVRIAVYVDLDVGQHRTGIAPDETAVELYRLVTSLPFLSPGGLHAYDGHLKDPDPELRAAACDAAFEPVKALREQLQAEGLAVPAVVVGGSPTFPIHARREGVELSPGTTVLWDAGNANRLPDLEFLPSVVLLMRVVSKPLPHRLCLDLGHKAVASEMPHPRVIFLNLPAAVPVMHSEEHLVVESPSAIEIPVGACVYGLPWHVCPTMALYDEVYAVRDRQASATWRVTARGRRLSI